MPHRSFRLPVTVVIALALAVPTVQFAASAAESGGKLPGKVTKLKAKKVGKTKATVSWRTPKTRSGPVVAFRTRIEKNGKWRSWKRQSSQGKNNSRTWKNLKAGTSYQVEVKAVSGNGGGPKKSLSFTTKQSNKTPKSYQKLQKDVIVNADMWAKQPKMLAAGLGFTDIIGVPGMTTNNLGLSQSLVRRIGGAWNTLTCADSDTSLVSYTSANTPEGIELAFGKKVYYADGLPIEFSWPVLPSSIEATDFAVELNDGSVVTPEVASISPNFEYNERGVVVIFGYFGNRIPQDQPGALYPVRVSVVADGSPLKLVGPKSRLVPAVGMTVAAPGSPYVADDSVVADRKGPRLVAAKLNRMSTKGEGGPKFFANGLLPNDGVTLYGDKAQYRLRVFTSGGMTADGVRGLHPDEYESFFRVNAKGANGDNVALTKVGTDYAVAGGVLRVEGLADLGLKQSSYDDCYREDKDNQIDIILSGDLNAARSVTSVEIPGTEGYGPLYNPGGPGNNPIPGFLYSSASPPINQPVMLALDNPMTVTYRGK